MGSGYVLQGGNEGIERLRLLAQVHAPATDALLSRLHLPRGARCLDVGCGIGEVTMLLARRHPGAHIVGADLNAAFLAIARAEADRNGLDVEFQHASVDSLEGDASFDLVYARCLLSHLPEPAAVLRHLVACVRPGGILAVEDVDFSGAFSHPRSEAFERYVALFREVVSRRGGDATLGRQLPGMLVRSGLQDTQADAVQPVFLSGVGKTLVRMTLDHTRAALVGESLATSDEIDALVAELASFEQVPDTLLAMPRVVQAWGRR
jgi:ubiquinone/menaquinone biosynthesis C-methylase UbiE